LGLVFGSKVLGLGCRAEPLGDGGSRRYGVRGAGHALCHCGRATHFVTAHCVTQATHCITANFVTAKGGRSGRLGATAKVLDRACIEEPSGYRANMAHVTQPRPDSSLGFQIKLLDTFKYVPSSLGSGERVRRGASETGLGKQDGAGWGGGRVLERGGGSDAGYRGSGDGHESHDTFPEAAVHVPYRRRAWRGKQRQLSGNRCGAQVHGSCSLDTSCEGLGKQRGGRVLGLVGKSFLEIWGAVVCSGSHSWDLEVPRQEKMLKGHLPRVYITKYTRTRRKTIDQPDSGGAWKRCVAWLHPSCSLV